MLASGEEASLGCAGWKSSQTIDMEAAERQRGGSRASEACPGEPANTSFNMYAHQSVLFLFKTTTYVVRGVNSVDDAREGALCNRLAVEGTYLWSIVDISAEGYHLRMPVLGDIWK